MRIRTWLKNVFVPHAGNDYAPHSLQQAALFGMLGLVLISFAATNLQSLMWIGSQWMVSTILPAVIINETNQQRVDGHLIGLTESPLLDAAANLKARDMAAHQYFSHFSPTGVSPWHWFTLVGYHYQDAGENLAINFTDSSAIVTAWMHSPEHRANIMSNKYTQIGVGTAAGVYQGYKTVYVVQLFGTPYVVPVAHAAPAPVATASTRTLPKARIATTQPTASASVLAETTSTVAATKSAVAPAAPSTLTHATTATTATAVATAAKDHGALFSDLATTPASNTPVVGAVTPQRPRHVPLSWQALTQPQLVLEIVYGAIALFVLVSLGLSIAIEWRRQQPYQIVYSVALLVLMIGLFYVHTMLVSGVMIG